MADEIVFAVKSCFAGVHLDGFDFIQGLVPWISSEGSEDFIGAELVELERGGLQFLRGCVIMAVGSHGGCMISHPSA